jgi:hypothetical protein
MTSSECGWRARIWNHGDDSFGIVDPHRHVDDVQLAESARLDPFFGAFGGGGEAVVQIDPVAQVLLFGKSDHLLGQLHIVRDRFLAEDRDTGGEDLHGRRVVIAAVLDTRRADTDGIDLDPARQHILDRVEAGAAVLFRCLVRFVRDNVTDRDYLAVVALLVDASVDVTDATESNNRYI